MGTGKWEGGRMVGLKETCVFRNTANFTSSALLMPFSGLGSDVMGQGCGCE